jgi:hypothetical protein
MGLAAWLNLIFSGRAKKKDATVEAPVHDAVLNATGQDYDEWMHYLAQRNPMERKPGSSLKEEYEQWLIARAKKRAAAHSHDDSAKTPPVEADHR